ncbi:MAG: hypothetical protein A2600_10585 [Candidatus Lambdaproteobacteria bacterium RIFOXYD1_FULL_56_27]|uniref:Rhodanese domain-containing protein n=1 Tax=Candidatus Lambdaproteobacteria bacterium RIFOXYD2_FULL_56_26 TaxID=1817773 RepID=A0A1F6GZ64_9PROT|nr:MAG: hypothetical protein A2426_01030 [Candidatus Lambdaproteobacteria bacterium RIFOXYC1_FULL_56_13]OGH03438.1 MAG: hypothetical protein A2557_01645 [Candidatus Lambdaproteobacteria bacterium RIFOXYD2_FULL_56_26]OGH08223.1 MAG: hypothetical protein A2600_10585 [Candidatus Lambdaproteobacteria bacterium RIFOXYD1_FULL_56_27]
MDNESLKPKPQIDYEITVIEAYELMQQKTDLQLWDLREPIDFGKVSVPGFTNIPLPDLSAELGDFDSRKRTLLIDEDGTKSHQARQLLEACGYQAWVIRGGLKDWAAVIGL